MPGTSPAARGVSWRGWGRLSRRERSDPPESDRREPVSPYHKQTTASKLSSKPHRGRGQGRRLRMAPPRETGYWWGMRGKGWSRARVGKTGRAAWRVRAAAGGQGVKGIRGARLAPSRADKIEVSF